ncbi:hypothetical protein QR680_011140 [Steinernema hermaphroditum]|uniref:G-protein coupled receptors family 1 profile domain-containing protein n=1 Tax=Steinernema hermaphroditum TaxID=289476 RepID=A0AA39IR87_9BILA|nr:hypothetical protein QR680_011140 [Steinernema hermaphroditum]
MKADDYRNEISELDSFKNRIHPNATILFRGYIGFAVLSALSTIISDGIDAVRLIFIRSDSGCPIPLYTGKIAEILMMPMVFCVNALGIMFIFIGVERSIATIYTAKYEKMKSTVPGWALLFIAVCVSLAKAVWFWAQSSDAPAQPMATIGDVPFYVHYVTLGTQLFMEVINIVLFTTLYWCNKRRKYKSSRVASSLTYKYQLNENYHSIIQILRLAWLHCLVIVIATVVIFIAMFCLTEEQGMRFSVIFDLYPVYHCLLPVALGYRTVKDRMKEKTAKVEQIKEQRDYKDQDHHFKMLQDLFDKQ